METKQEKVNDAVSAHGEVIEVYRNTDDNCAADAVQVLFNNSLGDDAHVALQVINRGKCPVIVGTGAKRGDFSFAGQETLIPQGANETVRVKVPRGSFLMASCINEECHDCDWSITKVRPLA